MAANEPSTPAAQRPLAPTGILGGALALYRRRWPTLLAIAAVGASLVVSFPSTRVLPGPGSEYQVIVHHRAVATAGSWADTAVVVLAVVVALLAVAVVAGALTRPALAAAAGEDLGVGRGYRYAVGRTWPLLQVLLLTWLLVAVAVGLLDWAVGLAGDGWLAQTVAQAVAVALASPLVALVGAPLYLDLRDRPRPLAPGP